MTFFFDVISFLILFSPLYLVPIGVVLLLLHSMIQLRNSHFLTRFAVVVLVIGFIASLFSILPGSLVRNAFQEETIDELIVLEQQKQLPYVEQLPEVLKLKELYPDTRMVISPNRMSFTYFITSDQTYYLTVPINKNGALEGSLYCILQPSESSNNLPMIIFEKHNRESIMSALEKKECTYAS